MKKTIMLFAAATMAIAGCKYPSAGRGTSVVPFSGDRMVLPGAPCVAAPVKAKLLHELGVLALFAGETESDAAFNAEPERKDDGYFRNSIFLRRRTKDGGDEWRLLLTSGGDWKEYSGMGKWSKNWAEDIRKCFNVVRARLSRDGRSVWMVCDPPCSFWYDIVCRFDLSENTLHVLIDGDSADEEPDGTIWVLNKKIYLYDKNGVPDGAAWVEEWITPDGKVVKRGEPKRQEDVLVYDEAVKLRRNERETFIKECCNHQEKDVSTR